MKRPIQILLQTTIPERLDDWPIGRFSLYLVVTFENSTDAYGNRLGRAIAESSFHHFVDYNWDTEMGCPSFLEEPPGDGFRKEPDKLEDFKVYIRNLALWLAQK